MGVNNYKIIGLEKMSLVNNIINIRSSFIRIINSVVLGNAMDYEVYLSLEKDVIIEISSRRSVDLCLNPEMDIAKNWLLLSLIRLSKGVEITIINKKIVTTQELDFNNIESGLFQCSDVKVKNSEIYEDCNKITFKFYQSKLEYNVVEFLSNKNSKLEFIRYLNNIYNIALEKGMKFKINSEKDIKLKYENSYGKLINYKDYLFEEYEIRIYMNKEYDRKVNLVINDIIISEVNIKTKLNFRNKHFQGEGYSTTRIHIEVRCYKENFNLNDDEEVERMFKKSVEAIYKMVDKNISAFVVDYVHINVKYKKEHMRILINETKRKSAAETTEYILNEYLEPLIKKDTKKIEGR